MCERSNFPVDVTKEKKDKETKSKIKKQKARTKKKEEGMIDVCACELIIHSQFFFDCVVKMRSRVSEATFLKKE